MTTHSSRLKILPGVILFPLGVALMALVFRLFPIKGAMGFDGVGEVFLIFCGLIAVEVAYFIGVVSKKIHPVRMFLYCLAVFVVILVLGRAVAG